MQPVPIYVDFDDVLCETARALTVLLEHEFGKRVAFESIHTFNLAESFGLTEAELQHLMDAAHKPAFLGGLAPIPGALHALQSWQAAGCEVDVVTGRPAASHASCLEWLQRHEMPYRRLLFVDKYARNHLPGVGVPALSLEDFGRLSFSLAVEDAPKMIQFLASHTPTPIAVIERPWNRHVVFDDPAGHLHRCLDWNEILVRFPAPGLAGA